MVGACLFLRRVNGPSQKPDTIVEEAGDEELEEAEAASVVPVEDEEEEIAAGTAVRATPATTGESISGFVSQAGPIALGVAASFLAGTLLWSIIKFALFQG